MILAHRSCSPVQMELSTIGRVGNDTVDRVEGWADCTVPPPNDRWRGGQRCPPWSAELDVRRQTAHAASLS